MEIKRMTDEKYYEKKPWQVCHDFSLCKKTRKECEECQCDYKYLYNQLAMREDYDEYHGMHILAGCNLLILKDVDIKSTLEIIKNMYNYNYMDFTNFDELHFIESKLPHASKLNIFDLRPLKYDATKATILKESLTKCMKSNPNTKIIAIEDMHKKIPKALHFISNIVLMQDYDDVFKIDKSFPMIYDHDTRIKLRDVL